MGETAPIVVMKFGGTSLADEPARASLVERVRERADEHRVVLVVSAMGRRGAPYATDTLLGLVGDMPHEARESARLAACGEIISTAVVSRTLAAAGIPARGFSGAEAGIITGPDHDDAHVIEVVPDRVLEALDDGLVPVVAGFQGLAPDGELTTLGRGGSDTTACVLAVALDATRVEIYSDVEGVMTADPADAGCARVLDVMDYRELFQMAQHGSRVVHAPAAEAAMRGGVPMLVRSTFSGAPGTLVTDAAGVAEAGIHRVATAVSHVDHVARFVVTLPPEDDSGDHMAAQSLVYETMAVAGASLDMFTPCGDLMVFSTSEADSATAIAALDRLALPYEVETGLAKVTLVGSGMHGVPGVMALMSAALRDAGVSVRQTADSHATISVLVWQNMRSRAVQALHEAFSLDSRPAVAAREQTGERAR